MDTGISPTAIRGVLEEYFSPLPTDIEAKVQEYIRLLCIWGRKMPLTSVREADEIVRFHFGESLFALSVVAIQNGRLADVGTGAGFPGLALKLARPDVPIALIEPNKKKCAFLHEVIRAWKLTDVEVISETFEGSGIGDNSLSCITSRALGSKEEMLSWANSKLDPTGNVVLWIGREHREHISSRAAWSWDEPRLIPYTRGRFVLRGRPIR